jgi:hypothetical protein
MRNLLVAQEVKPQIYRRNILCEHWFPLVGFQPSKTSDFIQSPNLQMHLRRIRSRSIGLGMIAHLVSLPKPRLGVLRES